MTAARRASADPSDAFVTDPVTGRTNSSAVGRSAVGIAVAVGFDRFEPPTEGSSIDDVAWDAGSPPELAPFGEPELLADGWVVGVGETEVTGVVGEVVAGSPVG